MKKTRYLVALLFTGLIFVVGILIGSRITTSHAEQIQQKIEDDLLEMQSLELEMSLVREINSSSLCNYIGYRLPEIIRKKVELGRKFDVGDIPEDEAFVLKRQYVISLTKYWLFSEVNKRECNINNPTILFFFNDYERSREQGRILDYLVYRSNESITVFSFNMNWIDQPLVNLFMINYNVTEAPAVVLDGVKYYGVQSKEQMTKVLCANYNLSFC